MSNLHLWKTKGKGLAEEYISCMGKSTIKKGVKKVFEDTNYKRMREIQDSIGVKRC